MRSIRGIASAVLLALAGLCIAALCIRYAALKTLPPETPVVAQLAPHDPDIVLDQAALALVKQKGIVAPAMLAAVRRAAAQLPLDARPYLVLGHQQLLDDQPQRALATLEAGQRLDPRQRVIHLLLLDRYVRTRRLADAAPQLAVSARLVGAANGPIAVAMAQMSASPATRAMVRETLRTDPRLERAVMIALANSDAPVATLFAVASPAALRDAGAPESWGAPLVARLIGQGHYDAARAIWQRLYHLSDAQVRAPLFNASLAKLPAAPPFGWSFAASTVGAADPQNHALVVEYYGRDSGTLAGQLLVLHPGSYRFAFTAEGSKIATGPGASLSWSLHCVAGDKAELMRAAVTTPGTPNRIGATFMVPAGCAAQQLTLDGEAGEFPAPINVTLRDLDVRAMTQGQP